MNHNDSESFINRLGSLLNLSRLVRPAHYKVTSIYGFLVQMHQEMPYVNDVHNARLEKAIDECGELFYYLRNWKNFRDGVEKLLTELRGEKARYQFEMPDDAEEPEGTATSSKNPAC